MNTNHTVVEACALYPDAQKAFKEGNYLYVVTGEATYRKVTGKTGETRSIFPTIKVFPNGFCVGTNYTYQIGVDIENLTLKQFYEAVEPIYKALQLKETKLTADEKAAYESLTNLLGF